ENPEREVKAGAQRNMFRARWLSFDLAHSTRFALGSVAASFSLRWAYAGCSLRLRRFVCQLLSPNLGRGGLALRTFQESRERRHVINQPLVVSAHYLELAVGRRFEDHIQRQLHVAEGPVLEPEVDLTILLGVSFGQLLWLVK